MIAVMFEWYILVVWYLLWILLIGLIAADFVKVQLKIREARRRGLYPAVDQDPTLDDVKRLAAAGERLLAVKLYGDLRDVGDKEARDAVAKMEVEFQGDSPASAVATADPPASGPA